MKIYRANVIPDMLATDAEVAALVQKIVSRQVAVPAPPIPATPVPPIIVTASSIAAPAFSPDKCFDGNPTTLWANNYVIPTFQNPETLTINYTKPEFFEGYRLVRVGNPGQGPISWDIETSRDGSTWVLRDAKRNISLDGNPIMFYWDRPEEPDQYLRIKTYDIGAGGVYVGIVEFAGIMRPESRLESSINSFTYQKNAHGFLVPSVVAWNGTDWVVADKDGPRDAYIVVAATANSFTVALSGKHRIDHGLGNNPGAPYLGDNGALTRTAPATGQQLILGQILDAQHLWIQPEWRAA